MEKLLSQTTNRLHGPHLPCFEPSSPVSMFLNTVLRVVLVLRCVSLSLDCVLDSVEILLERKNRLKTWLLLLLLGSLIGSSYKNVKIIPCFQNWKKTPAARSRNYLSHAPSNMQAPVVCVSVLLSFLLLVPPHGVSSKKGKKLEETDSFDVKPSGQIAHQTIRLVSTMY